MLNESKPRATDVAASIIADVQNFADPTQEKAGFANTMDLSDGYDLLGALREAGALPVGSPSLVTIEMLLDLARDAESSDSTTDEGEKTDAFLAAAAYMLKDTFDAFQSEKTR